MSFISFDIILDRLQQSRFRSQFKLHNKERNYLANKGIDKIMEHAADFIHQRLAPTFPKNDGKQTPWKGHPIFIAQHATATCCRSCLEKWHHIHKGHALTQMEEAFILNLIQAWIKKNYQNLQSD